MRSIRTLVVACALSVLGFAARPLVAAEPGCQKWDLEVTCTTNPNRVIVTDPFTATITVRNTGDVALTKVTVQLRGDVGAHTVGGAPMPVQTVLEKLEPGESQQLSGTFACDTVGMTRVLGGARDGEGWAAANCACTVDVIGLPAIQSEMTDKDIKGVEKGIFVVGETFIYELDVQNDVGTTVTPDLKVVFQLPKELEFVSGKAEGGRDDHRRRAGGRVDGVRPDAEPGDEDGAHGQGDRRPAPATSSRRRPPSRRPAA